MYFTLVTCTTLWDIFHYLSQLKEHTLDFCISAAHVTAAQFV